jgi:hypothetical protein
VHGEETPAQNTEVPVDNTDPLCVALGFRRSVNEICGLLGFYAAQDCNFLPTFRVNLLVLSSKVKHSTLRKIPRECSPHTSDTLMSRKRK